MENQRITKSELDAALNALEHILDQPVDEIDLTDEIPPVDDVADSNKVFKGKLSILFVDMRKSTDLTDELKAKKMVKIYRASYEWLFRLSVILEDILASLQGMA